MMAVAVAQNKMSEANPCRSKCDKVAENVKSSYRMLLLHLNYRLRFDGIGLERQER